MFTDIELQFNLNQQKSTFSHIVFHDGLT